MGDEGFMPRRPGDRRGNERRTGWDRRMVADRRHDQRRVRAIQVVTNRRAGTERRLVGDRRARPRRSGWDRRSLPDRRNSAWRVLDPK
jgi:hypothetical protein